MQTPAAFEYERATSVEGTIASLQRLGSEARVIAGGHSLLPMMKLRLATPTHLIDINDLAELSYIREEGDEVRIGALTRHVQLQKSDLLARHFPLFRDAEDVIADPVVRNRGTIGGSLCQADAAEDLAAVCTAIKAKAVIRGADGERVVGMEDFHAGPYMTAVGEDEMLTEVRLPVRPGGGSAHEKVERRAGDWAIAAASAAVWIESGTIADAGLALSAVGLTTIHRLASRGAAAGQAPVGGAVRAGGRDRRGGLLAECGRSRAGRLQAPPRRRPHATRSQPRDSTRPATGGLIMNVSISVNGEQVSREIEPRQLLVHFIRETPELTGTHWGCDTSNCGACVVLMDGEPVKSCTILAAMCRGPRDPYGRVARDRRTAGPDPAGLPRAARPAVRLLHAGHADDGARPARREP